MTAEYLQNLSAERIKLLYDEIHTLPDIGKLFYVKKKLGTLLNSKPDKNILTGHYDIYACNFILEQLKDLNATTTSSIS